MGDTIAVELNIEGDTVQSYYCEQLTAYNTFIDLVVPYYYDLVYPCSEDPAVGRGFVADSLLSRSKNAFMEDATVCVRQQDPWFAKVSSLPADTFADFDCQELLGACCIVVAGNMTFTQVDPVSADAMKRWIAANLNDPTIAPNYKVAYIGSELAPSFDPVEPVLPNVTEPPVAAPPFAINRDPPPTAPQKDSEFTMVGILILIGMIMLFITTVLFLMKRRQRFLTGRDVDAAIAQSELQLDKDELAGEHIETATWEDRTFDDDVHDLEVNVLSDNLPHDNMHIRSVSSVSYRTGHPGDGQNSTVREPHLNRQYRFDLASSYKNDVMGAYGADLFGPTEITVVPPYPMEEGASESEADSWAQTDGTVGSLDDDHLAAVDDTMETGEI